MRCCAVWRDCYAGLIVRPADHLLGDALRAPQGTPVPDQATAPKEQSFMNETPVVGYRVVYSGSR